MTVLLHLKVNGVNHYCRLTVLLSKCPCDQKNHFLFIFGFQNYVNQTLSDQRLKPLLKKKKKGVYFNRNFPI